MSSSAKSLSRVSRAARLPDESASARPPRVYVSSTYQDLKECRQAIRLALQRMGLDDIAMETYTAGEERPIDRCLDDVRSADIYVGVLAWRYGFVPPGEHISITELEYRAAGEAGIPRLIFLLGPDAPWPRSAMDKDSTQIEEFRDRVREAHVCDDFNAADDLRAKVAEAVGLRLQNQHGIVDGADAAWEAYCNRLVQEYRRLDLEALTPPDRDEHLQIALQDVFVEPDVREDMPDAELPKELLRKLDEAADSTNSELPRGLDRHLVEQARDSYRRRPVRSAFEALTSPLARTSVLLGDPGAGKSTLARYLAMALAEGRTPATLAALDGWHPILIELRDYALNCGEYETFSGYLDYRQRTDGLGIERVTIESYLRDDGRALVVFDGLDEIFDPRLRETVSRRIAGFAAEFPTSRVVVTSRVVGYRPRILRDAGFVQYTVQDLDHDKIDSFLRRWYELALHDRPMAVETRRERLLRAINDSAPIRELAGNPLLLTILAIIGKHQELPRERWRVYDHAAGVLVQHWDVNKHLVDENIDADVIREEDKKELLRKLAIRMQEGSHGFAGNSLVESDLFQDIESYLTERFRYAPAKATAISTAMVKQLRERNFIFARYGSGVYGFVHRALLEFFSAGEIVNRFEKTRTLSEEALIEQIFVPRSEDPTWAEVLRLVAGMVDAMVATRLINGLLSSAGTYRSSALNRRPLAAVELAAQCVAEIRNVHAAASAAEGTLAATIELLESPARSFGRDTRESRLEKTVLPAMNAVTAWPGRATFHDWFVRSGQYASTTPAAKLGAQFMAALFPKDERVCELLHGCARSAIPRQRQAALLGLAQAWKHESATVGLVVDGLSDEEAFVRRTSLDLLVTSWPDYDRAPDLMLRAVNDADREVRSRAVEALAQHAANVPGAWPAVIRALRGDGAQVVRDAAVTALASDSANPQETLSHLLHACSDPAWQVRRSALRLVVTRFAAEPAVFDRVLAATRDGDEDVRQAAVESLAGRWSDAPESMETVRGALRDTHPTVRHAAVPAMAQWWRDDPEVEADLRFAETDPCGDVRVAAMTAWTDPISQAAEYVAILDSLVADDPVADVRRAALTVLVSEAAELSGSALEHGLADLDPNVRRAALRSLSGAMPRLDAFRPAVLRLCADVVEGVQEVAVEVAARFWGDRPDVVRILHRATRSRSQQLRRMALESLASRWPDATETWQALNRGRRDPSGAVRHTAATVSYSLEQDVKQRAAIVAAAATDPHVWTRRWAATLVWAFTAQADESLDLPETAADCSTTREAELHTAVRAGFDEAAMSAVRAATDDPDPDVRLAAYEIVSTRREDYPDALDLITKSSRDIDQEIRLSGLTALLAVWPGRDDTNGARRRGLTDPSPDIRQLALESLLLNEPESPETHRAMITAVTDADWSTRRLALDTLNMWKRDHPETLSRMYAALHHPEESVREAAIGTLRGAWPADESMFNELADCLGDPAPNCRIQVLRSITAGWPHDGRVPGFLRAARRDHDSGVATAAWELQRGVDEGRAFDGACRAADLRHPDVVTRQLGAEQIVRRRSIADDAADLLRLGLRDLSAGVRSRIQFALMSAPGELTQSILRNADRHPNDVARRINVQVRAARWPDAAETQDAIRQAMADIEDPLRMTALDLFIESNPEAGPTNHVAARPLGDTDWEVRLGALRLIAACWPDEPGTRDRLVFASRDYDPDIRQAALEALVIRWPRHSATLAALTDAETDVTWFVRNWARLTRIRLRSEPSTSEKSTTSPRFATFELLQREDLNHPDDPTARFVILDLVESADWWIRRESLQLLARRWPDWTETELALTRALNDDDEHVRNFVTRQLTSTSLDPDAAVPMLCRAAREPSGSNRASAVELLHLWRNPETQAALAHAAKDQNINVNNSAIKGLIIGWPTDSRTQDALGWAVCSSFHWLHNLAYQRLSAGVANTSPDRATLLTAQRVPELLLLASWWGEDPAAEHVLREHCEHHDILRAATLTAILARSDYDPATATLLLLSATKDECPAVRRLAFEALVRTRNSAWIPVSTSDPDSYLRFIMLSFRSLIDMSPEFSAEIIDSLRSESDPTQYRRLFHIVANRVSVGLIDPATLVGTLRDSYVHPAEIEWLQWRALRS